jgi:hypothetical protein
MAGIKGIQHFESFHKIIVKTIVKKQIIIKIFYFKNCIKTKKI